MVRVLVFINVVFVEVKTEFKSFNLTRLQLRSFIKISYVFFEFIGIRNSSVIHTKYLFITLGFFKM